MNELIKVTYSAGEPTVSARDLHEGLEIKTAFKDWFPRMIEYGFEAGKDFNMLKNERVQMEGNREVRREITDYQISVDMAKQICMIQRNEKGKQYREYFLELEKAWNTPEQVFARALRMANQTINSLKDRCQFLGGQVEEQQKVIEELQPKASYYDMILQCKDLIATTVIATRLWRGLYINNLANGDSVYLSSLYGYIHDVHGVVNVQELSISTDGETFSMANIIIEDYEMARCEADDIEVEVVS